MVDLVRLRLPKTVRDIHCMVVKVVMVGILGSRHHHRTWEVGGAYNLHADRPGDGCGDRDAYIMRHTE